MKKAMVVLAVLAMAVSGCDTGLQDEIDDLKGKNKELEQELAKKEAEKGDLNKKVEALDLALAADTDAKRASAKTALIAAGYEEAQAEKLVTDVSALTAEIAELEGSQVMPAQKQMLETLDWLYAPERRIHIPSREDDPVGSEINPSIKNGNAGRIIEFFKAPANATKTKQDCIDNINQIITPAEISKGGAQGVSDTKFWA